MANKATLYDAYGRPINLSDLKQEYAESQTFGVRNFWNDSVAGGLTPATLAMLIRSAREGNAREYLTLAEEMEERYPHFRAVLATRRMAITGIDPIVEPGGEDAKSIEIAKDVEHLVKDPSFSDMLDDLLDAISKGYSCVNIPWRTSERQWWPTYKWRDPRSFKFHPERRDELRIVDEVDLYNGREIPPWTFIIHRPRLKSGHPLRGGIALPVSWYYLFQNYTIKDWLAFVEVFGIPIKLGRYGVGAKKDDIQTLVNALINIGSDAGAVIPKSMEIEILEAAGGQAAAEVFERLAEYSDKQVSKVVLGQTMTTDDGSSLGQAKVHENVMLAVNKADARQLAATVNRDLIRPFVDINYGPQKSYPRFVLPIMDPEDTKSFSEAIVPLIDRGLKVAQAPVLKKFRLEPAEETDDVLYPSSNESLLPAVNTSRLATNAARPTRESILDELERRGGQRWKEQMAPILAPVFELVENANSFQEVLDGLDRIAGTLDVRVLAQQLAEATFIARAAGDANDAP